MRARFLVAAALTLYGCVSVKESLVQEEPGSDTTAVAQAHSGKDHDAADLSPASKEGPLEQLSRASLLMLQACENYLTLNPESPKRAEVIGIKASLFYNNRMFQQSRSVYQQIVEEFPQTGYSFDATRMIAQAFYEEQRFDEAQEWYRRLRDAAGEGEDRTEAVARIAESLFRLGEQYENQQLFTQAAAQYERVAMEFPDEKIADVALFNAGLAYERLSEWSRAILVFQRLLHRYSNSALLPRAQFRIAKCYEKLNQWDNAAESYLRLVANYPQSELAPSAIYNAGFSFENSAKLREAAATFERMVELFPASSDAADVLFRSGELYGRLQDWESAERVTNEFSRRFGNDADRIIQALCMRGIALYMQDREGEALRQFNHTVSTFRRMNDPSSLNAYYAAKAQFTIGEIYHGRMNAVQLTLPRARYRALLRDKNELLEDAVEAYTLALQFGVLEWTTRSIFGIGQINEDFAIGIFRQQRPLDLSIDELLNLELGIAEAVERYYIDEALYYHEQNVKLAIKEKLTDQYAQKSKTKLTVLPFLAAENYMALSKIATDAEQWGSLEGIALMSRKFQLLQKIAPYQQRAIGLYLKALETGSVYEQIDEFYTKSSDRITSTSRLLGDNYFEIVRIARDAPIPESFEPYERFVYKNQLSRQVDGYEDQALEAYLRGMKIAEAYGISDSEIDITKKHLAMLLFERGRYLDLLGIEAFTSAPLPEGISDMEQEEYLIRFEDIGLELQQQAMDVYATIVEFAMENYAAGEYVKHAYVRLFQENPASWGERQEKITTISFSSGRQWRVNGGVSDEEKWYIIDYDDNQWHTPQRVDGGRLINPDITDGVSQPMWYNINDSHQPQQYLPATRVYFRRRFSLDDVPFNAALSLAATGDVTVYLNENVLSMEPAGENLWRVNVKGRLRQGNNILAVLVDRDSSQEYGLLPLMSAEVMAEVLVPRIPRGDVITVEQTRSDRYSFPELNSTNLYGREK